VVVISSSQLAVKASENFELQISFELAQVKVSRELYQTTKQGTMESRGRIYKTPIL
jgi:hypothetical protein